MSRVKFVSYWNLSQDSKGSPWVAIYVDQHGSHISGEELLKRGIPIPLTPTYQTWVSLVSKKRKCPRCYKSLRGCLDDYVNHANSHKLRVVAI